MVDQWSITKVGELQDALLQEEVKEALRKYFDI